MISGSIYTPLRCSRPTTLFGNITISNGKYQYQQENINLPMLRKWNCLPSRYRFKVKKAVWKFPSHRVSEDPYLRVFHFRKYHLDTKAILTWASSGTHQRFLLWPCVCDLSDAATEEEVFASLEDDNNRLAFLMAVFFIMLVMSIVNEIDDDADDDDVRDDEMMKKKPT